MEGLIVYGICITIVTLTMRTMIIKYNKKER